MGKRIIILLFIFAGLFWWASQNEKGNQEVDKETQKSPEISEEMVETEEDVSFWQGVKDFFVPDESDKEEPGKPEEVPVKTSEDSEKSNIIEDPTKVTPEDNTISKESIEENLEPKKSSEITERVDSKKTHKNTTETSDEKVTTETGAEVKKEENIKTSESTKNSAENIEKTDKNNSDRDALPSVSEEPTKIVEEETTIKTPSRPTLPNNTSNVRVYIYDNGIDFSEKNIAAGTINFEVINTGRFSHEFVINEVQNFGKIPPRSVAHISVGIFPGTYEVYSDYRKDYERGVRDIITVE
jgi:hypothetical protein